MTSLKLVRFDSAEDGRDVYVDPARVVRVAGLDRPGALIWSTDGKWVHVTMHPSKVAERLAGREGATE